MRPLPQLVMLASALALNSAFEPLPASTFSSQEFASETEVFCYAWEGGSAKVLQITDLVSVPSDVAEQLSEFANRAQREGWHVVSHEETSVAKRIVEEWHKRAQWSGSNPYSPALCVPNKKAAGTSNYERELEWAIQSSLDIRRVEWTIPVDLKPRKSNEVATQADASGLKALTLRYGGGGGGHPGYRSATIDLNYRFIACMGEVHVAYSLDRDSLNADGSYVLMDGATIPAGDAGPKPPSSVGFTAAVGTVLGSEHVGKITRLGRIALIGDVSAGPALGYGCFSGQTQKIGRVSELVRGKHDSKDLDAILNNALELSEGYVTKPETLRDTSIERGSVQAARDEARAARDTEYQAKVREYERLQAERQQKIAEIEAAKKQMAEQQAAQAARAQAVQEQYQQEMAAHQTQVDAANRARAEYEAQLSAMGLVPPPRPPSPSGIASYVPPPPAQAPAAAAPAPAQATSPAAAESGETIYGWCYAFQPGTNQTVAYSSRIGRTEKYVRGVTTDYPDEMWQDRMRREFVAAIPGPSEAAICYAQPDPAFSYVRKMVYDAAQVIEVDWAPN